MPKRLYFHELAKKLGIPGAEFPPNPDQSPPQSAGPMVHPNVWGQQGGEKLLAYLKANYGPGDTLEYDGHADCWLMLAMLDQMRECHLCTYIGAGFDRVLSITSYRTGKAPAQKQPCTFQTVEHGDDILLTVCLRPHGTPFDMPFEDIIAPEILAGKNIFVRLAGRHLLFAFPVSLTYGQTCRSIVMDYAGECVVSVSNTPELTVGQLVTSPFSTIK